MQKEDKEPSAPPPPYPGAPESGYQSGYQSVYPAVPSNYSAFPAGQSAFPAGYSTGQEVFAPHHPGYPVGLPQHPMPTGGYPQQQPGYIPLHPGAQSGGTAVVYQQPEVRVVATGGSPPESFVGQIVTSCVATWCCFLPLGIVAFILALVAQSKAQSNRDEAHRIGIASYAMSGLSVVVVIVIVLVIILTS